jgi:hypothetical protein
LRIRISAIMTSTMHAATTMAVRHSGGRSRRTDDDAGEEAASSRR